MKEFLRMRMMVAVVASPAATAVEYFKIPNSKLGFSPSVSANALLGLKREQSQAL